jgi:hypothetical protein
VEAGAVSRIEVTKRGRVVEMVHSDVDNFTRNLRAAGVQPE